MLCSLELKAAGLNLQFANHIMFVHPFYSPNEKQANSWEAQAIGRLLRIGQENQVNIWRFISLDTIDQELLIRKNLNSGWKDHFDV
jgi:SNF2 family DNA or RNA helicase